MLLPYISVHLKRIHVQIRLAAFPGVLCHLQASWNNKFLVYLNTNLEQVYWLVGHSAGKFLEDEVEQLFDTTFITILWEYPCCPLGRLEAAVAIKPSISEQTKMCFVAKKLPLLYYFPHVAASTRHSCQTRIESRKKKKTQPFDSKMSLKMENKALPVLWRLVLDIILWVLRISMTRIASD